MDWIRIRKFQGVSSITLFFQDSYNGDETRIYYIGLKGESKKVWVSLPYHSFDLIFSRAASLVRCAVALRGR